MGPAGSLCPAMATAHTLWRWWSPEIKAAGSQCRRQAPETVTCTLVSDTSAVTWESAVTVGSMSLQHHVPHAHRGRDCGSTAQSSACTACPLVTMGPCVPTSVLLSLAHSRNTSQPPSWLRSDVAPSSTLGSVAFLIHSLSPLLATCQRAQRGPQWGMAQPMGARTTARALCEGHLGTATLSSCTPEAQRLCRAHQRTHSLEQLFPGTRCRNARMAQAGVPGRRGTRLSCRNCRMSTPFSLVITLLGII